MLDLNEITAVMEAHASNPNECWIERKERTTKLLSWLPALVEELREARAKIDAQAAELRNIRPEVERLRGARAAHGNAILDSAGVLCIEEADDAQLE